MYYKRVLQCWAMWEYYRLMSFWTARHVSDVFDRRESRHGQLAMGIVVVVVVYIRGLYRVTRRWRSSGSRSQSIVSAFRGAVTLYIYYKRLPFRHSARNSLSTSLTCALRHQRMSQCPLCTPPWAKRNWGIIREASLLKGKYKLWKCVFIKK